MQQNLSYLPKPAIRFSPFAIVLVLVLHIGLMALLLSLDVIKVPPLPAALMVHILPSPPVVAQSKPELTPPKPAAMAPQPIKPKPVSMPKSMPETPLLTTKPAEASSYAETHHVQEKFQSAALPSGSSADLAVSQPGFTADYLHNPAPEYPPLAKRMGEQGKVLLRVHVEATGKPSRIEIKQSSGSLRLDQAAEQAIWRWKFTPAKRGNEAIDAWVVVPISFNLRDS